MLAYLNLKIYNDVGLLWLYELVSFSVVHVSKRN